MKNKELIEVFSISLAVSLSIIAATISLIAWFSVLILVGAV